MPSGGTPNEPDTPKEPDQPRRPSGSPGFGGGDDGEEDVKTVLREHADGVIHRETTIHVNLPQVVREALHKHDIKLKFQNPELIKILHDQSAGMVSTDGCISEPGGPGC